MRNSSMAGIAGVGMLAGLAAYLGIVRPWQLRWGATDSEVELVLPGDEIVTQPHFVATRGVTVQARPEQIWPWLLQIGSGRAGWYSIDLIDNGGVPSVEQILPKYQHIAVGDFIPFTPDAKNGLWVHSFEEHHWILWWDRKGAATWLWRLEAINAQQTRLVTRLRTRYSWALPWSIYYLIYDVGDIVMMSQCMLGIKRRAERLAAGQTGDVR